MSTVGANRRELLGRRYSWPEGPSSVVLASDRVDVWLVHLDELLPRACSVLSTDELNRAGHFHFEKDRVHFTRCRATLRFLLSRYLRIPGGELRFEYQSCGKPELATRQNPQRLQFNVAHSAGLALIAVSAGSRIGIDIEKERNDADLPDLAERFFSTRERAGLRVLPDHLGAAAFFACWTRKESFLKATGEGLSFPLADFSVSTHPDFDPELEEIRGNSEARKRWLLKDLSVADGYRATVAVEGSVSRLETYTHQ